LVVVVEETSFFLLSQSHPKPPEKFLKNTNNALHYFLNGALFNVLRILELGIAIGYLYPRLYPSD
jgi:hypothetical protein